MNLFRRLWRLEGTVDRRTYLIGGAVGFALKYAIDWSIATQVFGARWSPLRYWRMFEFRDDHLPGVAFLTLLAVSLPFLWFGMAMTLLRLRDAGASPGWAALFFMPVANVLLFGALVFIRPRPPRESQASGVFESVLFASVATTAVAATMISLSTEGLALYGMGLFIAVPFCVGYLGAFLHVRRFPAARVAPFAIAAVSLGLLSGLMLALAWEGAMCVVMAAPLALAVAMLGAKWGQASARRFTRRPAYMTIAALPLILIAEAAMNPAPPVQRVESSIVINATPAVVWKHVIAFPEIDEAPEWYFRAGIAYPLRARIDGHGPGAIRYCEFTTGAFVEPIEIWDEPRLLQFSVASNPPPMRELSPRGEIDPPHLRGYLESQRGQFLLEPLPGGRTRLTGTTWYRHRLWPSSYWRLWSDAIIHRIHMRVLRHIARVSVAAG